MKGRRNMRMDRTEYGSQVLTGQAAMALRISVSERLRENRQREEQVRALARRPRGEDAANVRYAMRSVEHRICKGLHVLEISLPREGVPTDRLHGLEYMREHEDHFLAGKWLQEAPRPAVPSPKEISAAIEAVRWIDTLDEEDARLLRVAAQTKKGERSRRIGWERVFVRLPHLEDVSLRTLQERYDRALRFIVAELTLLHIAK